MREAGRDWSGSLDVDPTLQDVAVAQHARILLQSLQDRVLERWQDTALVGMASVEQLRGLYGCIVEGKIRGDLLHQIGALRLLDGIEPLDYLNWQLALFDIPLLLLGDVDADAALVQAARTILREARDATVRATLSPVATEQTVRERDQPIQASYLHRILTLSTTVGPETSPDSFAQRVAQIASEIGGFPYAILFLIDTADDAFYAEAMHGVSLADWQEILALAVPRRVYRRVSAAAQEPTQVLELRVDDPLLQDDEVAACFGPLQSIPAQQDATPLEKRSVFIIPLEVPGKGTIGFCAAGGSLPARRPRQAVRRALQALAAQGAISIENLHLYRLQQDEAAVSSALLQVAGAVGTTDIDLLVQRTLNVLPRLFGGQFAGLLYLDRARAELRMLEPTPPDGALTLLTEARVTPARLERLEPALRGQEPLVLEEPDLSHLLPAQLVQTRGVLASLLVPLNLPERQADAVAVFWTVATHRFRPRDLEVARGVSELVGVALTNARLFGDARERAEHLAALYRTGQMMSSSLDLDAVLRTITGAAVQLTHSALCVIYLIDPKSGLLEFVAGSGLDTVAGEHTSLRPGEGLLGRCALQGQPLLVDDLRPPPHLTSREPAISSDMRSAIFLPLKASGEVIGVLGTAADTPGYFLPEHQQILQNFANQAAVSIERARLYAAEQRRRELAELQQTMTQSLGSSLELGDVLLQVVGFAQGVLSYDLAGIHVYKAGQVDLAVVRTSDGTLSSLPFHVQATLHDPLYSQMLSSDSTIVVSDTGREPLWRTQTIFPDARSWIGVPLLNDGEFVVVLELFSSTPGIYTQEEADSIAQFGQQVAFAVRNARIYAREREAKTRLEELDQLRADFVSTVSHELRTPLTGIKGFTETLLSYWQRLDDERKLHYLDRIYGASKRLQRLVQDLLFVSKVEGGNLPLSVRKVNLGDLLEPAVSEIKQKYRGQVIDLEAPATIPMVLADADRTQQVLVNLMDNGVKYSAEGSPILVRCVVFPDYVEMTVLDHGPGIRPQDLPRLFTRFGKIDQVIRAGHVGTGLGLFISKQLVEQMGGVITVHSVVGEGSTFGFTLPRADR